LNKKKGIRDKESNNKTQNSAGVYFPPIIYPSFHRLSRGLSLAYNIQTPKARPTNDPAVMPPLSETPALSVCSAEAALLVQLALPVLPVGFESGTWVEAATAVSSVLAAEMAELRAEAEAVLVLYMEPVCVTETAASVCWSMGSTLAREE
jgi:hypothetical protein